MTEVINHNVRTADLSVEEFLARLKTDPRTTGALLRERSWQFTSTPVNIDDFWELFDTVIQADGTVDVSALSPTSADVKIDTAAATVGHGMAAAAAAIVTVWMAAAAGGYELGTAIGEALDDKKESAPAGQGSKIVVYPGADSLTLVVTDEAGGPAIPEGSVGQEVTSQDFLARLKRDRQGTLQALRSGGGGRIVCPGLEPQDFGALIDSAVKSDGTFDLAPLGAPTSPVVAMGPLGTAIGVVVGGAVVCFVVGVVVGVVVETLGDSDEPDTPPPPPSASVLRVDIFDTGEESGSVTATLRPGDGSGINMRVRRTE